MTNTNRKPPAVKPGEFKKARIAFRHPHPTTSRRVFAWAGPAWAFEQARVALERMARDES